MHIRYQEPHGRKEKQTDPLPKNWRNIEAKRGTLPRNFAVVDPGKLYRSEVVFPKQIPRLQEEYGIAHIISLLEGDQLEEYYTDSTITIHQFPFYERKTITPERMKDIVTVINSIKEPALVHCLRGITRTGMICAAYQLEHGLTLKEALSEYRKNSALQFIGLFNRHTVRDIKNYAKIYAKE